MARPPLALERQSVTDEGKLRYALKHPYSNGTTHFLRGGARQVQGLELAYAHGNGGIIAEQAGLVFGVDR